MRKPRARAAAPPASGRVTIASPSPASSRWRRCPSSRPAEDAPEPLAFQKIAACPRSATISEPRLPGHRARPPVERHPGRLRPPHRRAGDPGRGRVRRRHRRRSGRRARHPGADAEPARRGHDQPQLDPDRRGAGAARRRRSAPAPRSTGPRSTLTALTPNLGPSLDLLADVVRNPAFEPGEVERLRAAAARRDRQRADPARRASARARCRRLLYGAEPSLRPAVHAAPATRPSVARADPRRPGPLPPELDPARQRHDLRGRRPAARRAGAAARGPVRQLGAAGGAEGDQEFRRRRRRRRSPRIVLIDRPQSPQSLILAGAVLPVRGTEDLLDPATPPTRCSAATSCRGSTWTCARPRAGPTASRSSVDLREQQVPYSSTPRSRPTRPARRSRR